MYHSELTSNYNKQINRVINYILGHLMDDLSLAKLADIANYSPFHFQKVFKEVVGQTPKQFINLTKLRSATGFLIIDQPKPVSEIAFDCGFSSPSVFARSFKRHFGLSAEKLRAIPAEERVKFINCESFVKDLLHHGRHSTGMEPNWDLNNVTVKSISSLPGIFTNTSIRGQEMVNGFRKSFQIAETIGVDLAGSHFIGIIYPHHDLYRAFISFNPCKAIIREENQTEIKAGRYATFKVSGEIEKTFVAMDNFYRHWLPHSGYRIANIFVFEILSQNPVNGSYREIEREVHIPIEPI
jgi:AraC family transcriptional regulator